MTWTSTEDIIDAERDELITDVLNGVSTGAITSSGPNSGNVTGNLMANLMGTTLWSTVKGAPRLSPIDHTRDVRLLSMRNASIREISNWLVRAYVIGTFDPTSTSGNRLTHHSAGFPLTRYRRGAARPIAGLPGLLITTTLSTTAFVCTFDYINQDGNPVVGTKQFTAPATNAAMASLMFADLEDGDTSVQDITAINVTTASAAGALRVYLLEPIAMCSQLLTGHTTEADFVRGQRFVPPPVQSAEPASGVLDSELLWMGMGGGSTNTATVVLRCAEHV